jgi:ketosteroid isomerase-like protein
MADCMISNLGNDGEGRVFRDHGHATLANAGGVSVLKGRFEPGFRWSDDVQPMAGTSSCQIRHMGYVLSGSMHVRMDDGSECDIGEGDVVDLPAGHDAWVTSDTAFEMIDVSPDATRYAVTRPADIGSPDDQWMTLVRRGYAAFNSHDVETLTDLFSNDIVHHVPGHGPLAGTYKGIESVLGYFGKLAEMTDGTFRADLIDVHGDGSGHVCATHQTSAVRNGAKRVTRGAILFTLVGAKVIDVLELHADLPGDDAFFA